MDVATYVILIIYTVFTLSAASTSCARSSLKGYYWNAYIAVSIFGLDGFIFLITGVMMTIKLRLHFRKFFTQFRCILWLATICLSIPLLTRAVIDLLIIFDTRTKDWLNNHIAFDSTVLYSIEALVPVFTQMFSLVFGFSRHN
jgi:hypothetical protein